MSSAGQADASDGTVQVDGARLHYARTGTGGTSLVLLHGLTDDSACWARVATALADDFDIVIPDARGHGRSSGADGFTVPRLARDVSGILDGMGIRDALLFGHSMGAITAAVVAADRPDLVRAVVLEDPPFDVQIVEPVARRAAISADVTPWRDFSPDHRHAKARTVHPEWDRLETDPWADAKAQVDPAVLDQLGLFEGYDWRETLARLERPGLLVTGDPALGAIVTRAVADEALRLWPSGRVVQVAGAGHCVHRDRWAEAMKPISSYLLEHR